MSLSDLCTCTPCKRTQGLAVGQVLHAAFWCPLSCLGQVSQFWPVGVQCRGWHPEQVMLWGAQGLAWAGAGNAGLALQ